MTYVFYSQKFVPLNPLHLFHPSPYQSLLLAMSSLLSMSLFVFCLFICFWLLDFTYKWNHVVFVFLCLIYHRSVQSLSRVWFFLTPWTAALRASLSITISQSLLISTESIDGNAIQPSHPLSYLSLPAFNPSQYQGLFQWVSSSHQMAKVLELQHQSFQWIFSTDFL